MTPYEAWAPYMAAFQNAHGLNVFRSDQVQVARSPVDQHQRTAPVYRSSTPDVVRRITVYLAVGEGDVQIGNRALKSLSHIGDGLIFKCFTGDLVNRPDYFGFVLGSVADHNNVLDGVRFIPKNDINGGAVVNTDFLGFVPQIGNNQCATGFI